MLDSKTVTETIKEQQQVVLQSLPFSDKQDFDDVNKGFVDTLKPNVVDNAGGTVIWDNDSYDFLDPDSSETDGPDTANPSLWRQSKLCAIDGLFKVTEGINQHFLARETLRPSFTLTHSHGDHFGGVKGFASQDDVDKKGVKIVAPEGFLEHAVSENVYTGTAMNRRAAYMYGAALERGPNSQIGSGLGQAVSTGAVTLTKPTDYISETGESMTVDGVKMVFQMAPDTEAPAEMLIFFPELGALCAAEDATHTFHNALTLRGAVVGDLHAWARVLTETIDLFGGRASVLFTSNHWPTWGYEEVVKFLTLQRDLYAYVHDQTLRLLNKGLNGPEIAEQMTLPPALDKAWNARGYYGSVSHNVKAIYQRYMGWFDGNPAHLWEHIPVERAKRYVDLAGGIENIIKEGQAAFDKGDFRWAAEILNHAVFAEPDNTSAKGLLADTYEQLGYGAENGTWRNFFMSGAFELREKIFGTPSQTASADVLAQLTPEMLFDTFAIQLNGPNAWDQEISIKVVLTDGPRYLWWLSNGALVYTKTGEEATADVTLTTSTGRLPSIVSGFDPEKLKEAGIDVSGDASALERLSALLDPGDPAFNIGTP